MNGNIGFFILCFVFFVYIFNFQKESGKNRVEPSREGKEKFGSTQVKGHEKWCHVWRTAICGTRDV